METEKKKVFIVVPAFNEEKVISEVINEIKNAGYSDIIVVDDGGTDKTLEKAKNLLGKNALRHKINRGKGAATKTGIEAAKLMGADIIVTIDGDGQHDPTDINNLIQPIIEKKHDVVLGSRLKNTEGMPFYKILQNYFGNIVTWYLFGLYVTDSQSGFRAYSRHAANLINTKGDRYEYESEVIREIKYHKLKFKEVPIKVRYTEYSMGKAQKQSLLNGAKTLYKIVWDIIH